MSGGQGAFAATTDPAGVFFFDAVPPGNYMLMAQRNGYVRQDMAFRTAVMRSAPPAVVVGPGQAVTGVTVKLVPHSVVSGKVVDEDGEPVAGVMVKAQRERWQRGQRLLMPLSNNSSNDLGEYRMAGLTAGKYFISVGAGQQFQGGPMARVKPAGGTPETGYTTTFYPNVIDPAQATPIEVGAGQEARGIDFRIRKVPTYRVRGRVADAVDGPMQNVNIMVMPGDAAFGGPPRAMTVVHNQDGTFELGGLAPGTYTLVVNRMNRDQGRASATQQIQVGNRDLDGVVVALTPPVEVTGVVRAEGDAKLDFSRLRVSLEPAAGMMMFGGGGNHGITADGTFKLPGLNAGKYRPAVYNLPEGTYLKSVRQGPQEVLESGLQITGAGVPLEVVLGSNAPSVTGTVNDSNGKPVPGLAVALVPDAPRRDQYHLYLTSTTGDPGTFTFRNITPGNYKVFVLPAGSVEDIQNPAFLSQNESRGSSVKLAEGKTENLQLTF